MQQRLIYYRESFLKVNLDIFNSGHLLSALFAKVLIKINYGSLDGSLLGYLARRYDRMQEPFCRREDEECT